MTKLYRITRIVLVVLLIALLSQVVWISVEAAKADGFIVDPPSIDIPDQPIIYIDTKTDWVLTENDYAFEGNWAHHYPMQNEFRAYNDWTIVSFGVQTIDEYHYVCRLLLKKDSDGTHYVTYETVDYDLQFTV